MIPPTPGLGVVLPCSIAHQGFSFLGDHGVTGQGEGFRRYRVLPRGQLVLADEPFNQSGPSSNPPLAEDATCHAGPGPNIRTEAAAANPRTSTASPNNDPVGPRVAQRG